jgi:hypothetical protein
MADERDAYGHRRPGYAWRSGFKGMNPTVAALGIGAVFIVLLVLISVRSGHEDAKMPPPLPNKSGSVQTMTRYAGLAVGTPAMHKS